MVPVATLPMGRQCPAEISVVDDEPGGQGIAFLDGLLSETEKGLSGGQHQRKAETNQNCGKNDLLWFRDFGWPFGFFRLSHRVAPFLVTVHNMLSDKAR
jgi:hypothetical protein